MAIFRVRALALTRTAVLVLLAPAGFAIAANIDASPHQYCVVEGKSSETVSDGRSVKRQYTITTDRCGTFRSEDSLLRWNWHDAELHERIEPFHAYEFAVRGVRLDWVSIYPDLTGAKQVASFPTDEEELQHLNRKH